MNQPTPHRCHGRAAQRDAGYRLEYQAPQALQAAGARAAPPQLGPRADVLDPALLLEVHAINLRGAVLLQEAAQVFAALEPPARAAVVAAGGVGGLLAAGLHDWLALNAEGRDRLASQPFLLFEIALQDPLRWQRLLLGSVGEEPRAPLGGAAPPATMLAYARVLLHYAWHLARTAPRTAGVVAGMAADTAVLLRGCRVEQIDELAPRCAHWLQPRWPADAVIWADLLSAARSGGDRARTRRATLQALQRIGGELVRVEATANRACVPTAMVDLRLPYECAFGPPARQDLPEWRAGTKGHRPRGRAR